MTCSCLHWLLASLQLPVMWFFCSFSQLEIIFTILNSLTESATSVISLFQNVSMMSSKEHSINIYGLSAVHCLSLQMWLFIYSCPMFPKFLLAFSLKSTSVSFSGKPLVRYISESTLKIQRNGSINLLYLNA